MLHLIKEHKIHIIAGIAACIAVFYFINEPEKDQSPLFDDEELFVSSEQNIAENSEEGIVSETLFVDVKGAVGKPGVYEAQINERVIDIINKAGGLIDSADEAKINFAMRVEDEMVIYVPEIGEVIEEAAAIVIGGGLQGTGQTKSDGKVNLNTADETELQTLTGIGPSKAAAIIEFRETNGPFKAIEDLKSISGIGEKTFEKLKESIRVK